MRSVELDPREFIGCGLTVAEWVQLTLEEKAAFVAARDEQMERQAELLMDEMEHRIRQAVKEAELEQMARRAAERVGT